MVTQSSISNHFNVPIRVDGAESAMDLENAPRRVLVVEDDMLILRLYSDVLRTSGYEVDTAEDGDEGWKALHATRCASRGYDLMITDNNMPKLTGLELIIKLRSEGMDLPVIMATGLAPANTECLRISAVLTKPFTVVEFLKTVERVLMGRLPAVAAYKMALMRQHDDHGEVEDEE
jgi:DNA-binding response OmpR family regulator